MKRRVMIVLAVFAVTLHSCIYMKKSDYLDTEHLHHRLEFKVGKTKYSVVETHNRGDFLRVNPTSPQYVAATLTRTRKVSHYFDWGLMTAEFDKEDTLAIGARLTTEELSTSWDASLFFFVPFSDVKHETPIAVPPKDVYFFQGGEHPSTRAMVTSFSLTLKTILVTDYPSESYFEGTFVMSGVDKDGIAFKSEYGYFNVSTIAPYNPMEIIESYEEKYNN